MDVLELPRPVINFLRTMAKEGCRYVLSWDMFGGSDSVTLTLTWKLTEDRPQLIKVDEPSSRAIQSVGDDLHVRTNVLPRRARRDEPALVPAIFRSSRGQSLEGTRLMSTKVLSCPPPPSDVVQSTVQHGNPPPPSSAHTHRRRTKQKVHTSTSRSVLPSATMAKNTSSHMRRTEHLVTLNSNAVDDDDDTLDPWVKRFECSLEEYHDDGSTEPSGCHPKMFTAEATVGKVKFKAQPDYF